MALTIQKNCISCYACMHVCPKRAIKAGDQQFLVLQHRCNECKDQFDTPQCASICPVESAITDENGIPLVAIGSLTPPISIIEIALDKRTITDGSVFEKIKAESERNTHV